jgi:hypothetical protein
LLIFFKKEGLSFDAVKLDGTLYEIWNVRSCGPGVIVNAHVDGHIAPAYAARQVRLTTEIRRSVAWLEEVR